MQDRGYEIPRIVLLGTSVNKGKKKGRGCYAPALVRYVALNLRRGHPPHAMPHS
jgi:hypothetical protein